jgi:hypothetical protein
MAATRDSFQIGIPPGELAKFKRQVNQLAKDTGKEAGVVMHQAMQHLVGTLSSWTPPRGQEQGENRIRGDLHKISNDTNGVRKGGKDEAVNLLYMLKVKGTPENFAAARKILKQYGDSAASAYYDITSKQAAMLPGLHKGARDSKGAVRRGVKVDAGGLEMNRLALRREDWNNYLKTVVAKVGRLKAGWNAAAVKFRVKVADYAWRHGTGEGGAVDAINANGNGYLEASNRVPYIVRQRGLVRNAMAQVTRILQTRLKAAANKAAGKFNAAK